MEIQLLTPSEALADRQENLSTMERESISVSDRVFSAPLNEPLIHQAVTTYLANSHLGQKAQKNRAQVSRSSAKPWRQKGTGRARAGTVTSPLWRGGGVTFAAKPKKLGKSNKLNRKMYQGALRSILSELYRQQRLLVVEQFYLEAPKTQALKQKLSALNLSNVLIVLAGAFDTQNQEQATVFRAAHHLPLVSVLEASTLDPVSLLQFPKVLMTVAALKQVEDQLNDESKPTLTNH